MAAVRCSGCHRELAATAMVCADPACGFPAEAAPRTTGAVPTGSVSAVDAPGHRGARGVAPGETVVCDHTSARQGAVVCPTCGSALPASSPHVVAVAPSGDPSVRGPGAYPPPPYAVVRFPDSSEVVLAPGQAIEVGRDDGPLVGLLATTTTVSRRHATLALTSSGVVTVVDHASTNGTFIGGVRCPPSGPVEVPNGAEVAFSRNFPVIVEVVR